VENVLASDDDVGVHCLHRPICNSVQSQQVKWWCCSLQKLRTSDI